MRAKAKLFMSGRSQAVRLPKEFRFQGKEVSIRRVGLGVLLEPVKKSWDEVFAEIDALGGKFPKRGRQPKPAKRLPID
jgi:antitoxin VapB